MSKLFQMPQRLALTNNPGELMKGVIELGPRIKNSRLPVSDEAHLKLVRQCPCLNCGVEPSEAAHVRMSSAAHGKKNTLQRKPDDKWTVPLCAACHTRDPDSQHRVGEIPFWHRVGINPIRVAQSLYAATGDLPRMRAICFHAIAERESAEQMGAKR